MYLFYLQKQALSLAEAAVRRVSPDLFAETERRGLPIEWELELLDDAEMRAINREYRETDHTTDVLSFPQQDFCEGKLSAAIDLLQLPSFLLRQEGERAFFLGSVLISCPRLTEQAEAYGHSRLREFSFLLLHSLLHLLGFDHLTEEEAKRMEDIQEAVLNELGLNRDTEEPNWDAIAADLRDELARRETEDLFLVSYSEAEGEDTDEAEAEREEPFPPAADCEEGTRNSDFGKESTSFVLSETEANIEQFLAQGKKATFRADHVGYVSILGRPNVGKSTLLNALIGQYLAITSPKAQTTRANIKAILQREKSQIIFTDTPGMHKAESKLGRFMEKSLRAALDYCDLPILMADARHEHAGEHEKRIIDLIRREEKEAILVVNKVDLVPKEKLFSLITNYMQLFPFRAVVPISAEKKDGLDRLVAEIEKLLPEGEAIYDTEQYTDQSERLLCAEYLREQILRFTHKEVPHGTAVIIERFSEEDPSGQTPHETADAESRRSLVKISALILCERDSHKGIILGKNGNGMKRIATQARLKMEELLGCKVFLDCHIKVKEDWKNREYYLKECGYTANLESLMREIL